jgi:4-methyl-5(b-hydroxyethyl)-thiazole monophosphate biosynthesis
MIYVFLAEGFEEVEALTPVDLLRRCELEVKTVGIKSQIIRGSHGIPVVCDIEENEIVLDDKLQMIVLPGGMPGTLNLEKSPKVQEAIDYCVKNNIYIGAICAAPSILGHKGLLNGKEAICFPGFEAQLTGAKISNDVVCKDDKIITAKGAGVAIEFSLKLVETLISKQRADKLKGSLQCK